MEPRPIRNICLIQPTQPFPNMMSKVVMPRYGLPVIATILKQQGYNVTLFIEDICPINWEIVRQADAVGFNTLSCSLGNFAQLAAKVRIIHDVPIIVGGTHATYFPESVLRHADIIVRQEGDETILDLLNALKAGRDLETVAGISFKREGHTIQTADRPPVKEFNTVVDLSVIYGWEKAYKMGKRYRLMTIQTTRGCPFRCKFCPVSTMFSPGYRRRGIDSVIAELKDKTQYSKYVMFVDNNFAADPKRTVELLERIIEEKIKANMTVFCRSDIRKYPEILRLMKRAGITTIFMGVESLNAETLQTVNKCQTIGETQEAIKVIERHGIRVLTSLLMGVDTDTKQSLQETRRMLKKWRIAQMCVFAYFGAYPEKQSGESGIPPYRWIFKDWGYINGNFVSHFPKNMKPSTLQREIAATYEAVLSPWNSVKDLLTGRFANALWRYIFYRAWKNTWPDIKDYLPYLEEIEKGCYDESECLIDEKAKQRADIPWIMNQMS